MKEIVVSEILRCPRSESKVSISTCRKCPQFGGLKNGIVQCDFQRSCEPSEKIAFSIPLGLKEWIDSHPDPRAFLTTLLMEARKEETKFTEKKELEKEKITYYS